MWEKKIFKTSRARRNEPWRKDSRATFLQKFSKAQINSLIQFTLPTQIFCDLLHQNQQWSRWAVSDTPPLRCWPPAPRKTLRSCLWRRTWQPRTHRTGSRVHHFAAPEPRNGLPRPLVKCCGGGVCYRPAAPPFLLSLQWPGLGGRDSDVRGEGITPPPIPWAHGGKGTSNTCKTLMTLLASEMGHWKP